jgi:hypothetical protein
MGMLFYPYVFYIVVNLINYRGRYEPLSIICGGIVMKSTFLLIPIGYVWVGFLQWQAGCYHLIGECYSDNLPAFHFWLKSSNPVIAFAWIAALVFKIFKCVIRLVRETYCRYPLGD